MTISMYIKVYWSIIMVLQITSKVCNEGIAMNLEGVLIYFKT
jgi:hypothetical protein